MCKFRKFSCTIFLVQENLRQKVASLNEALTGHYENRIKSHSARIILPKAIQCILHFVYNWLTLYREVIFLEKEEFVGLVAGVIG